MSVQNQKTALEDVKPVIDENIIDTVFDIYSEVLKLNPLQDLFDDLAEKLITELHANSFMDLNLDLKEEQKEALHRGIKIQGNETVKNYLANINNDERTKEIYGVVKGKTAEIADAVLSSIGQAINRGAIINAKAVQANAKSEDHDEILLHKSKTSGDITIPTYCILISSNCVEVIKSSCNKDSPKIDEEKEGEKKAPKAEKAAAEKPAKGNKAK